MANRSPRTWRWWVALGVRVLLAGVFVVSAVAKLVSIDDFELYVFSFGVLPLNVSYVVARLCIVAELLLGVLIAVGWWQRWVGLATLGLLIGFSIFLCYVVLMGREESCQCFGKLVEITPVQSLLKNAVLIVVVLAYYRWFAANRDDKKAGSGRKRLWGTVVLGVVAIGSVFTVSVPDNWMFGNGSHTEVAEGVEEAVRKGDIGSPGLAYGHRLLVFVTPECPYCRLTRQKLGSIAQRHNLNEEQIVYFEPGGIEGTCEAVEGRTYRIGTDCFLRLTRGRRPYVVLMEEGRAVYTFHYRNISEELIVESLKDE